MSAHRFNDSSRAAYVVAACVLLISLSSCSTHTPKKANRISEYDTEFDPEVTEGEVDVASIPEEPEALRRAKDAYDSGLYSLSREHWTMLRDQYPGSYYVALAQLKIADTFFYAGDYASAIPAYEEFVRLHPAHEAVAYSRYQIAEANRLDYKGVLKDQSPLQAAIRGYQQVISSYPNSEFVTAARRKVDDCREHLAKHESAVAQFYLKQGLFEAGAGRLEALERSYPDSDARKAVADRVQAGETAIALATVEAEALNRSQGGGWEPLLERKLSTSTTLPAAPSAPELLLSRGDSRKEFAEFRYRLSAPKTAQSKNAQSGRPEAPAVAGVSRQGGSSLLLALLCESSGDDAVFTAIFREPVVRRSPEAIEIGSFIVRAPSGPEILEATSEEMIESCDAGGSELKISKAPNENADSRLQYVLSNPAGSTVTALELDRPYRVVFVVQRQIR